MTAASGLILIAIGAILAFAVSYELAGISIQTSGATLIVVGGILLANVARDAAPVNVAP